MAACMRRAFRPPVTRGLATKPSVLLGSSTVCPEGLASVQRFGAVHRRNFGSANNSSDYIPQSSGDQVTGLLERCTETAQTAGFDPTVAYEPMLPIDIMQGLVLSIKDVFPTSTWIVSIACAAFLTRAFSLPVTVYSMKANRIKSQLMPDYEALAQKRKALSEGGNQRALSEVEKEMDLFLKKHGRGFMFKGLAPMFFFQIPMFITAYASFRGFAMHPWLFQSYAMESPLWLDSLALPDPSWILPAISSAVILTNVEVFGSMDPSITASESAQGTILGNKKTAKYVRYAQRVCAVAFLPIAVQFPAGIFVWIISSSGSAFLQNVLFRIPAVERFLELPLRPDQKRALQEVRDSVATRNKAMAANPHLLAAAESGTTTKTDSSSTKTESSDNRGLAPRVTTPLTFAVAGATVPASATPRQVFGAGRPALREMARKSQKIGDVAIESGNDLAKYAVKRRART